jgi:hypothetical protein
MGDGKWGQGLQMRIPPNREDEKGGDQEKSRSYVLLASIGLSAFFWCSLFVILYFVWKR